MEAVVIQSIRGSLKNYFNFKGKASRKEFWTFYAFYLLAILFGGIVDGFIGETDLISGSILFLLYIPTLSCAVRKIHDTGKSGWFVLFPIYNLVLLIEPTKNNEAK